MKGGNDRCSNNLQKSLLTGKTNNNRTAQSCQIKTHLIGQKKEENKELKLDSDSITSSEENLRSVSSLLPTGEGKIDKNLYDQIYNLANRVRLMNYESSNSNNLLNDDLFVDPYVDIKKDILGIHFRSSRNDST